MEIEHVDPATLNSYGGNPRRMSREDIEKLKRNIQRFGVVDPLIVDEDDVVLGGNQRLLAVLELEMRVVPCVRVTGLSKEEKAALVVSLNKISGDWDELKLRELLAGIKIMDADILEFTAFSPAEIENLMNTMVSDIPELEKWDGEK